MTHNLVTTEIRTYSQWDLMTKRDKIFFFVILTALFLMMTIFLRKINSKEVKPDTDKIALTISTKTITVSGPNMEQPVKIVLVKDLKGKVISKTCFLGEVGYHSTSEQFCERIYRAIE